MMNKMKNDKGISGIEYGLIGALISVAIIGSVAMTGTDTKKTFCAVEYGLTDAYSGDCAQARVAELRSMISAFSMKIANFSLMESNLLGVNAPSSDEDSNWEQDKANAISDINGNISTDEQMISEYQVMLASEQADLAKNQGYLDGLANGTYKLQNDVIVGTGRTTSQVQISISKDKQSITSSQSVLTFYESDLQSNQALIAEYNADDQQLQEFYAQQDALQAEADSLSGS